MATYARYKFTTDRQAKMIGTGWHLVTKEYSMFTPSGLNNYITINGVSVKARHCEVVQVFTK